VNVSFKPGSASTLCRNRTYRDKDRRIWSAAYTLNIELRSALATLKSALAGGTRFLFKLQLLQWLLAYIYINESKRIRREDNRR
jgi:hypothetical protein